MANGFSHAMKHSNIAVLETPEPDWFKTSPQKGTWASWLIHGNHYGTLIDLPPKTQLDTDRGNFFIVLQGCVVAYGLSPDGQSKGVFVDALRKGDMIWPLQPKQVRFGYETRSHTFLLSVSKSKYEEFMKANSYSETVLMAAELNLMTKHSQAAQFLFAKDLDRIKRVITMLVEHPDSRPTARGIEVQASKDEIRTLAGVERRSGSRAFKVLEEEGLMKFDGYKTFFFQSPSEVSACAAVLT
ncbi:catabolite gene activator protein [Pseudomonas veronii 1YdBTEX2]|uniref:Catabolite gene activator protein n=1 Tax=Pseudomonas veronii 1YdBTEX2 TaxID=1295141 RepID=A0A1D3K765_PSEVE|nr:catabolite gene activator protein [Pseudomonas veronii 1YdBTEX2]